jgi:hypothetical protein
MALRSHQLARVNFGPFQSERVLAKELFGHIPERSLTIVDRGFAYPSDLIPIEKMGGERYWLTRARSSQRWKVVERFGKGDALCEMKLAWSTRSARPDFPLIWRARVIEYRRKGFKPKVLITSLLDPKRYPADEVVALYHERWELELGYDEVKTEMLERRESIRSKTPEGVRQEFWGILLAYNLVRGEMLLAARLAKVPPTRISFKDSLRAIKHSLVYFALITPGNLPKVLERLHLEIAGYVLPPRRSQRVYPRAVKIKMSNYDRKRTPGTRGRKRPAK